ncbi:MAG: T9SS type A sorting domain-containing protein [Ignavibacteriaceae bacterium]|nr:T9SS type A sorting domain-containing protein [Ignavibacteriaceae bacterium]
MDTDDAFCYSYPVKVTADVLRSILVLLLNLPNPFHPETTIKSGLPEEALITITFYYVTGKKIPTFLNTLPEAGCHISRLNTGDSGLSSGIYFLRITAQSNRSVKL